MLYVTLSRATGHWVALTETGAVTYGSRRLDQLAHLLAQRGFRIPATQAQAN